MFNETQEHKEKQNRKRFHFKIVKSFKKANNEMKTPIALSFTNKFKQKERHGEGI